MSDKTLEIARGLAALWVFLFHVQPVLQESIPWLVSIARHGSLGIWMFFVISGYCIFAAAENTRRQGASVGAFLKRRLLRIYPPFWISLVVILSLPYLMEGVSALKTGAFVWPQPRWSMWALADWLAVLSLAQIFFAEGGDFQGAFSPVNAVYWTLAMELQFYFIVAVALACGRHFGSVLGVTTGLGFASWLVPEFATSGLCLAYWPAFAIGIGLRLVQQRGWVATRAIAFPAWAALLAAFGSLLLWWVVEPALLYAVNGIAAAPAIGTAFALFCALALWFAARLEPTIREVLANTRVAAWAIRGLLMLGASSYSLYLLHGKLYQLPAMFARQVLQPSSPLFAPLIIVATVMISYGFFMIAERPFMSRRNQTRTEQTKLPLQPVATPAT